MVVRSAQSGVRVLLVDVAPDLVQMMRRTFPDAEVRVAGDTDLLDRALTEAWDVVIVDLGTIRLGQILPYAERLAVVGVTSSMSRAAEPGELADVLVQPVLGEDLRRSVGRLLGEVAAVSPGERHLARVRAGVRIASLAAVVLGLLAATVGGSAGGLEALVAVAAVVHGAARLLRVDAARGQAAVASSLVLAAILLLLTGGAASPYLPYAWLAAAEAGLVLGPRAAATAAATLALSTVPAGIAAMGQPDALRSWVAVAVVLPSVTVIATLARRLWEDDPGEPDPNLTELHRALGTVLHTAGRLPRGLAMADAASAVLDEATVSWAAARGVVLVEQDGALVEVGSTGLPAHARQLFKAGDPLTALFAGADDSLGVPDAVLPAMYRTTSTSDPWTLTPLVHGGTALGVLLWTGRSVLNDRRRRELRALSSRGGLAVATARRFERLRSLANDNDRARLRTVLEKEAFQQLLSLRYEVEGLAARPGGEELRPELDRLAAHTRDVAAQLREAAGQLTIELDSLGLGMALRNHCRELVALGVANLELDLATRQRPGRDAEAVAYELAITAIHDAISSGGDVTVRMLARDGAVVVEVVDTGTPLTSAGVELDRMSTAAAEFDITVTREVMPVGTCVAIAAASVRQAVDRLPS